MSDHPAPSPVVTAHEPPKEVVSKTMVQEAVKTGFRLLPHLPDFLEVIADVLGFTALSRQLSALSAKISPSAPIRTAASQATPVVAEAEYAKPSKDIADAPFGLSRFSKQDEVRMKRLWDSTVHSFRETRPTAGIPSPAALCLTFAKLAADKLNTYKKQEDLRLIIIRDPDDRKAVEGCREMVLACQTAEAFDAYMYQIGVLTQPTEADIAWQAGSKAHRDKQSRLRQKEISKRRRLGIDTYPPAP